MLHLDGSKHRWLPGSGYEDLILRFDDADSEVYYAQLVAEESTKTVMAAIREVVGQQGVFNSLYTDAASHFVHTPVAGYPPDREHRTRVARALERLEIELIVAHSPQARGRCEGMFGTWQGRLPQELRLRGIRTLKEPNRYLIRTLKEPNRYLREGWIGFHNRRSPGREELLWPKASFRPSLTGSPTDGPRAIRRGVQIFTDRTDHVSKKPDNLTC